MAGDGFATATRVESSGDGDFAAAIVPGWDIAGNANGGYLLAIAGRALAAATERPDPVTVTGHYLSPGKPGSVSIATSVVKSGRRFATAQAVLSSSDRPLLAVLGTYGDLSQADGPEWSDRVPPDIPDPDDCAGIRPASQFPPPMMGKIDVRLHPDDARFATGDASGRPLMRGWFRLHDDEPIDTVALLMAADIFPPTIFNANLPVAWTPTVELTVHVRARPTPGWLRCQFATHFITGGFLEEEGELWDETGRLVAHSRQLALLPRP
jgi:acyl-CoA thioesterase